MSLSALSVSELAEFQVIVLLTVISPLPPEPEEVVTITLVLPRAVCNVPLLRLEGEVALLSLQVPVRQLLIVPLLAEVEIVISSGSSSSVPVLPLGAFVVTPPVMDSMCPEVSTSPPSPDSAPPCAEAWPAKLVLSSDQTIIFPPLPESVASASSSVFLSTVVVLALRVFPLPWKSPPMRMIPPPKRPLALTMAPNMLTF